MEIKVYRQYFQLFFIPVFPYGDKMVQMRCLSCGQPLRQDDIQKHYAAITKTPFYLFSLLIIIAILIPVIIKLNQDNQKEKAIFVANPKAGDVYKIRKDENSKTTYYFLRLIRINGDTVVAYHSNLEYNGYISKLNEDDFFVKDEELYFLKQELKQMLDKEEINSVDRAYGDYKGFDRIK